MNKKKKTNDNPLHTEYGIVKNSIYVLGKIRQYYPSQLFLMCIGVVTGSLMYYLWSFIGKFVIDLVQIQADSPEKDISPLIRLILTVMAVELFSLVLDTIVNNRIWYQFIYIRMHVITERVQKALTMDYQMLEQPDILDMHSKAMESTGGNSNGIEGLMRAVYDFGIQFMIMLVTFTTVMALDWRMLIIIALLSVVQFFFFRYTIKKDKKEVWDVLAPTWRKLNYMERTTQDFDYAKDIRLFHMQNWLSGKQHDFLADKQEKMVHSRNLWIINSGFAHTIAILSTVVVYGVLIYSVIDRNLSIGDFTLYLGLATTFTETLTRFLNSIGGFKQNSLQVDDFRSFMDLKTEETGEFLPVPQTDRYTFTFENVSFQYKGSEGYALKNLNLTFEAGKRLAVVGINGAGKTTFIKLLLRLYDVTEGRILLNGTDIRRFRREEYHRLFAPVFQNVELFAFPMSENVSMDAPKATDRELARECLIQAGLADKLESLEKGVDTQLLKVIHDDGIDLSGGEKQKLALARALYKDAPVIVLDEPTAALDALAEYQLYRNFDKMIGKKSAVYISHRLSSTRFCDNIAMFRAGEMIEYGTHEELLEKGGAYAEMFEIQAQYYRDHEEAEQRTGGWGNGR